MTVTHEEIKREIESKGYQLLSEYKKANEPLDTICPNGHFRRVKIGNFRRYGCTECLESRSKKYTFEEVNDFFKSRNCVLLSKTYNNCKDNLDYICSCGNISHITFDNFKNKFKNCGNCRTEKIVNKRIENGSFKSTEGVYAEIANTVREYDCCLITQLEKFSHRSDEVEVLCKCGNTFITNYHTIKNRIHKCCPECAHKLSAIELRVSLEEIEEYIVEHDCILTDYEYTNDHIITFQCKCGNKEKTSFNSFQSKWYKQCNECSLSQRKQKRRKYDDEKLRKIITDAGCTPLTTHVDTVDDYIEFICSCGSQGKTTLYRFINGVRCRNCWKCWKGGITPHSARIRSSVAYRKWRISILQRDNHTCRCCGKYDPDEIRVHHIKNFSEHHDLRLDIDNGLTLCADCHDFGRPYSFHTLYGAKNNNENQLLEFIAYTNHLWR